MLFIIILFSYLDGVFQILDEEKLIKSLTDNLYNSSFEAITDNKVSIKFTNFVVEKEPKDGKSCRETLYNLVHNYIASLVHSFRFFFENNNKFSKEVEKLFSDANASVYPEGDTMKEWAALASGSYGLIEYGEACSRSKDITRVLHRFCYPDYRREEKNLIKLIKTVTEA